MQGIVEDHNVVGQYIRIAQKLGVMRDHIIVPDPL